MKKTKVLMLVGTNIILLYISNFHIVQECEIFLNLLQHFST